MGKILTEGALAVLRRALKESISGAKYYAGDTWRETAVTSLEIGTDGSVYAGMVLRPTAAEIVTQIALTDGNGNVLARKEESIAGSSQDTGVFYRFRFRIAEEE